MVKKAFPYLVKRISSFARQSSFMRFTLHEQRFTEGLASFFNILP